MKTHVQNQKSLLDTNTVVQILKNPQFLNMMKTNMIRKEGKWRVDMN